MKYINMPIKETLTQVYRNYCCWSTNFLLQINYITGMFSPPPIKLITLELKVAITLKICSPSLNIP